MPKVSAVLGTAELKTPNLWRSIAAECLGTLLLNFFGVMACVQIDSTKKDFVLIALTFGLVVFVCVQVFGHVSGAHVNPAVTVGMMVTGRTPIIRGVLYIIAQCVGAVVGTGIVKAVTPVKFSTILGNTAVRANAGVSAVQGVGVEFMLGFVLILVVFAVCDPHRPECKYAAPLAIGLTVALGHLATLDYTGSSMNPARSLGSAFVTQSYEYLWVYWVGPIAGAIASSVLYTFAFAAPVPSQNQTTYTVVSTSDKEVKLHMKRMDEDP